MSDRLMKWLVAIAAVTMFCSLTQAVTGFALRSQLSERDRDWQRKIDRLEREIQGLNGSVAIMQKAKLGQDDFNARVIAILEKLSHANASVSRKSKFR